MNVPRKRSAWKSGQYLLTDVKKAKHMDSKNALSIKYREIGLKGGGNIKRKTEHKSMVLSTHGFHS